LTQPIQQTEGMTLVAR